MGRLQSDSLSLNGGDHRWFKKSSREKQLVVRESNDDDDDDDDDDNNNNNNMRFVTCIANINTRLSNLTH